MTKKGGGGRGRAGDKAGSGDGEVAEGQGATTRRPEGHADEAAKRVNKVPAAASSGAKGSKGQGGHQPAPVGAQGRGEGAVVATKARVATVINGAGPVAGAAPVRAEAGPPRRYRAPKAPVE